MFEKWFRYFKHIFIWLQPELGKSLGSSTCATKNFEWLGIQRAVANKDVSWYMSQYHIKKDDSQDPNKGEDFSYTWPIVTQRKKSAMPQNQLNSANHLVSVFAGNLQYDFAVVAYNEILFYISYKLCSAFRLCSSMTVFYNSLEVIKLTFLENKSRYVCCIFANFIFTFETKR